MNDVYLDNVKKGIQRQIRWQGIADVVSRNAFLDAVIFYCQREKEKPFELQKSSKTRHGSGR